MNLKLKQNRLIAGFLLAFILVVNATVIIKVLYNRLAEPEAELELTEREVDLRNGIFDEDSGRFIRLRFEENDFLKNNEAKLKELGFKLNKPRSKKDRTHKKVFLVLELNGSAYEQAILKAKEELKTGEEKWKRNNLEALETTKTRLYLVDAGLNKEELRIKYPDKTKYAIVKGDLKIFGYYYLTRANLAVNEVFVPLKYAKLFDEKTNQDAKNYKRRNYDEKDYNLTVKLAFGKNLEPYIKDFR